MTYLWKFKKFPEPGVNPRYIRILLYLKDNGPTSSRELAMNLGYSVKAMRRALQFLRRIGAVEVIWRPKRGLEDYSA